MKVKFGVFVLGLAGLLSLSAWAVAYGGEAGHSSGDLGVTVIGSTNDQGDSSDGGSYVENEAMPVAEDTAQIVVDEDSDNSSESVDSGSYGGDSETSVEENNSSDSVEEEKRKCSRYGVGTIKFYKCKSQYEDDYKADQNNNSDSERSSTDFLSELEVKPKVEFEVEGASGALSGVRRINIEVNGAKSIDVLLRRSGTLIEYFIGRVVYADNKHSYVSWDTEQTPNGTYELVARVTNVFGVYESVGPVVNVGNKVQETTEYLDDDSLYWSDEVRGGIVRQLKKLEDDGKIETEEDLVEAEDIKLTTGIDSDSDGLTDNEELRLGTNRFHPDSDGDGYMDGLEVARGFNPLISSPGDKVAFTQPDEDIGVVRERVYVIESVEVGEEDGREVLSIRGRARPLAFVVLYIYSETPTVVTVRADAFGNFEYKLDKIVPDGEHRVYVALTDSNGLIVEKSKPLAFVKEAQAVVVTSDLLEGKVATTAESPVNFGTILLVTVVVVVLAILLAVAVLFRVVMNRKEEPPFTPPESTD